MIKLVRVGLLAVLTLGMATAAVAATDATPHQIYEAAQAGHLPEAQQMIAQVLQDHPRNAKAHFVAAELDARIGDLTGARDQLATARQLDPSQTFTDPQTLNALQRQLTGMTAVIPRTAPPFVPDVHRSAVPWGLIMVLVIGAFVVFNIFRRRAQTYGQGYGPGYTPGGSGLMGNLASGLAIGAGVVAGEELVRHVIDGNNTSGVPPTADFGTQDGSSWGNDSSGGDAGGWGGDSGGGGGDWS